MKTFLSTRNAYIVGFGVVVILLAFNTLRFGLPDSAIGSVTQGNDYQSTSTLAMKEAGSMPTGSVLKLGSGALGSVTISGAASGIITLYDATSTDTLILGTQRTLATFPASTAAGTYVFDVTFNKGLMYELSGAAPTSTITWR